MIAEKAYQLYFAVKLHFTSDYDVFERGDKFKGRESVKKKKDFGLINGIMKRVDNERQLIELCVCNHLYGNPHILYDHDAAFDNYTNWKRIKESLGYILEQNLGHIETTMMVRRCTIDDYMRKYVINDLLSGKIEHESIILLNHRYKCIDKIEGFDSSKYKVRMHKATKFVNKGVTGLLHNSHIDNFLASTMKGSQ